MCSMDSFHVFFLFIFILSTDWRLLCTHNYYNLLWTVCVQEQERVEESRNENMVGIILSPNQNPNDLIENVYSCNLSTWWCRCPDAACHLHKTVGCNIVEIVWRCVRWRAVRVCDEVADYKNELFAGADDASKHIIQTSRVCSIIHLTHISKAAFTNHFLFLFFILFYFGTF